MKVKKGFKPVHKHSDSVCLVWLFISSIIYFFIIVNITNLSIYIDRSH